MSRTLLFALLAVVSASLACSVFVGGPDLPTARPAPSEDPLDALDLQMQLALTESAANDEFSLRISQEQLTAYVASRLGTQNPPVLIDPQVVLGDQEMILYGRARSGMVEANLSVTTEFEIDSMGRPKIRIAHAELGPLPMPQPLQDGIAAALDEALTGSIGPAAIGFRLKSIDISGGFMTITGRLH